MDKPARRRICLHYTEVTDGKLVDEIDVEFIHYVDGTLQLVLDGNPAQVDLEAIANWAYTLSNWKRRIEKDLIGRQPQTDTE